MQIIPSNNFRALLIALGVFLLAGALYFLPNLQGKAMDQGDSTQFRGGAREIMEYREMGRSIYWTNTMFSGMPNYALSVINPTNFTRYVPMAFRQTLGTGFGLFVIMALGFFVLMMALKVDLRIAIATALIYALGSYFIIVLAAGHNSKYHAMAYLPGILAGVIWAYRQKKPWLGAAVLGVFTALEINASHPQMFYYFLSVLLATVVYEAIQYFRRGAVKLFLIRSGLLLVAAVLAVGTQYPYLKRTLDYGKYSTRGESELSEELSGRDDDGLDRDYITNWSYGVGETFTWLIPNFKGGASEPLSRQEKVMEGVDSRLKRAVGGQSAYFGNQPFVSGPVYLGAAVMLLAIFGFFYLRPGLRWPMLIALILMTMLSWGKNFEGLTNFFIDNVPLYDKFRAVSSIMVIPSFIMPLMAALSLQKIVQEPESLQNTSPLASLNFRKLFYAVAGLLIFFTAIAYAFPGAVNDFLSDREATELPQRLAEAGFNNQQSDTFLNELTSAREALFQSDARRSLFVLILGAGFFFLWQRRVLATRWFVICTLIVMVGDMWLVDRRYLNDENYVTPGQTDPQPTPADRQILQDKDPYYRVLNLTKSPFNDATTSFFHFSVGGYSGIKLRRYQDLIDFYLQEETQRLSSALRQQQAKPQQAFRQTPLLNALNLKHVIVDPNGRPLQNPERLGNAWYVNQIKTVPDADAEIQSLGDQDLARTAVLREDMLDLLAGGPNVPVAQQGSIQLQSYDPEKLVYRSQSEDEGFVVFSEIYFPEGWKLQVDGEEKPLVRTDFALRGAVLPAGQHEVVMTFEKNFQSERTLGLIAYILLAGLVVMAIVQSKKEANPSS